MTLLNNNKAVLRTALATQGLFKMRIFATLRAKSRQTIHAIYKSISKGSALDLLLRIVVISLTKFMPCLALTCQG